MYKAGCSKIIHIYIYYIFQGHSLLNFGEIRFFLRFIVKFVPSK